jgi:hypothetical protein
MSVNTWMENRKARARRRKLEKELNSAASEAKRRKDSRILDDWYTVNGWEFDSIDAEIKHNDSRDLMDQAAGLYVPTPGPNEKDKWVSKEDLNSFENWSVLTPEAMTELRSAIRKERRERREAIESWAKILAAVITVVTGLVGAVIGLVAVWKK